MTTHPRHRSASNDDARGPFEAGYFAANYADYERQNPERKLRFYRQLVEDAHADGLPRRIHDVGCAFARFLASIDDRWQRFGSDTSHYAIRRAAENDPGVSLCVASASHQPFAPLSFGCVTSFDVLEHVDDLDIVACAVKEQLVDRGTFVFVVPVYDGLAGPIVRLLDRDPTHLHKWPRRRWLDWAAEHFEVVRWTGMTRYLLGSYYVHWVSDALRQHTPAIAVVCRKRAGSVS